MKRVPVALMPVAPMPEHMPVAMPAHEARHHTRSARRVPRLAKVALDAMDKEVAEAGPNKSSDGAHSRSPRRDFTMMPPPRVKAPPESQDGAGWDRDLVDRESGPIGSGASAKRLALVESAHRFERLKSSAHLEGSAGGTEPYQVPSDSESEYSAEFVEAIDLCGEHGDTVDIGKGNLSRTSIGTGSPSLIRRRSRRCGSRLGQRCGADTAQWAGSWKLRASHARP